MAHTAPPLASPVDTSVSRTPRGGREPVDRSPRKLGRRVALPAGRAVVGGLLVTVAAVGTFAAYASANSGPSHHALVAATTLRPGQQLHDTDLRRVAVDVPDEVRDQTFDSAAELDGAVVLAPLVPDELITRSAVRRAGITNTSSARELSFALEREHAVDGRLQRGEWIDLVATYGSGAEAYTTVVAHHVQVLDADAAGTTSVGSNGKITITVSLETEAQVLEATHALEVAKVNVVRSPAGDDRAPHNDGDPAVRYSPGPPNGSASATVGTAVTNHAEAHP